MDKDMYPAILEDIIHSLNISKEELESHVHDITEYWETCLDKGAINNRDTAILVLTTCVSCYLTGRGINLENSRISDASSGLLLTLVTLIPLYAWTRPENNFPKIHALIPCKKSSKLKADSKIDILSQAEDILRNKWPQ